MRLKVKIIKNLESGISFEDYEIKGCENKNKVLFQFPILISHKMLINFLKFTLHNNFFKKKNMLEQSESNNQNQKQAQNQVVAIPDEPRWKYKSQRHIFPVLNVRHICNIQDSFFINQNSLKDPEHQEQSFLKTIFYFKSVAKVSVSQHYVTLHLKKREDNYLPQQYFIQRFKSFGNKEFYDIAVHLEHICQHLKQIKSMSTKEIEQNFSKQNQQKILEQSLQKLQKKKFFCFFYQFTQQGCCLNQIIISKALLNALGYDYEDTAIDFLKYQQAIFEIISAKLYCLVMERKSQLLDSVFQKMKENILSPEEVKKLTMFRFNDDLLPKSNSLDDDYERKIRSRVKFSKTHPSVTIFQIEKMNKKGKLFYEPKNKLQQEKINNYKQSIKNQEYQCVRNLLKVSENCLEENTKKMSSYRMIRKQPAKKRRKIIQSSSDSEYLGFD